MPLQDDYDLQSSDIQELSSRDRVATFFARLGYHVDARLTQTAEAMGLTAASIQREIRHIERIASHDDDALHVYLAELKSVTVSNIQAIARSLRNRAGVFLWVLTSDYERLDFVLFEPVLPGAGDPPQTLSMRSVIMRPRVLTVNRRDPGPVDLRVLRRFSYTEADADYQFQKLLSAYGIAEWSEPLFNNRALFSDYYLAERLPDAPEWGETALAAAALRDFQSLMADARRRVGGKDEAAVRAELLEPALKTLGFRAVSPSASTRTNRDSASPAFADYLLFASGDPTRPLVYCNAYTWDRNLDGPDEQRDPDTPAENPGALVVSLLDQADSAPPGAAPDWAIITNGKVWRLYARRAASRASNYYEIDLEEAVHSPDPGLAFRYFWLLFRAAAFAPTLVAEGQGQARCFLDRLIDESALYARQLGERLKDRVFEDIFPQFAAGFIAYLRANEGQARDLPLPDVFHGTLTFLYRLLFLLYAESRDLLPAREQRGYYEISLQKLKREMAGRAGNILDERNDRLKKACSADSTELYDHLARLFGVIDRGDPALNVPPYNGGLFVTQPPPAGEGDEQAAARFLAENKIPDRYLALGLDLMARDLDDKTHALAFIDYKSLGVRQLGSIYEGLLEFKLRVAEQKMAVVKGKKADEVIPHKDALKQRLRVKAELPKGAVYLENDRRERKATGSYYTPDYIVEYIVQHTVGPVLEDKFAALRPRLREAEKGYFEYETLIKARRKALGAAARAENPETYWNGETLARLAQDVLDVKVLDPAMGSGHFLVEAVDFVADRMIDFLNGFPHNPVTAALRRSRQAILSRMEAQGVSIDPGRLTDVNLLRRQVLKRCVYGVDLNPSAVELAKVSLWLHCFTLGAPLSFLDHHLRCGNSLIGVMAREAARELQAAANKKGGVNYTLFGGPFTGLLRSAEIMRGISALGDATLDEVRESAVLFGQFEQAALPYKRLLDVFVIRHFDVAGADDFLRLWGADVMTADPRKLGKADKQVLAERERLYRQHRFFHWDLEFPEVFIDLEQADWKENPGFDSVVGNPPYGSSSNKQALEVTFPTTTKNGDVYVGFTEQAIRIVRALGIVGYIIPITWETGVHYSGLRQLLYTTSMLQIVNLPFNTFPDAYVDVGILVTRKQSPVLATWKVATFACPKSASITDLDELDYQLISQPLWVAGRGLILLDTTKLALLARLDEPSQTLSLGTLTSSVRGVLLSGETDLADVPRNQNWLPFFRNELDRYAIDEPDCFVHFGDNLKERPATSDHFAGQRILVRRLVNRQDRLMATLTERPFVNKKDIYVFKTVTDIGNHFLVSLLNSRLLSFAYIERDVAATKDDFRQVTLDGLRSLPVRRIAFTTPVDRRAGLVVQAKHLYTAYVETRHGTFLPDELLALVDARLSAQSEESDVIHDLLAYLAEQMIDLNQRKQAEQKRFLGWLETALQIAPDRQGNTGLDALTGKTTLRNYLGDYQKGEEAATFDQIVDVLHKNRTRLGVSLSDAQFMARLRGEFDKSLAVLLPIKAQLARTDALIDQIVYKLYGLTEEEIKVVGGS